jgi:hypothetical protein
VSPKRNQQRSWRNIVGKREKEGGFLSMEGEQRCNTPSLSKPSTPRGTAVPTGMLATCLTLPWNMLMDRVLRESKEIGPGKVRSYQLHLALIGTSK